MKNNYELIEYDDFNNKYESNYYLLLKEFYASYLNFNKYINEIKKLRNKENPSLKFILIKNIQIYNNERKLCAHCTLIIDNRNSSCGIFGFYESIEDDNVAMMLFKYVKSYFKSKKCKTIIGPINLTIWNNYRLSLNYDENNSFLYETINKSYYEKQLSQFFKEKEYFYSAKRNNFNNLIMYTKKVSEKVTKNGFYFKNITNKNSTEYFQYFFNLSNKIFKNSPSFVSLTIEEYSYLYTNITQTKTDYDFIQLIFNKNHKPVGFCFSIIDPNNKNRLILKTLAILPEYQKFGLGTAFLYLQHKLAKKNKITEIIYALIRYENNIRKMIDVDATLTREYVLFKDKLK